MSKFLSNSAIQEFDSEVKHIYQGMATLRNCVSVRTGVTGDAYKFARMGDGIANQKATQADVTPMNVAHDRQTALLANWNAPEYTDIFDQAEVNFDEKQELAQTVAKALGRREDQIIIDQMASISYATSNDLDPDTGLLIDVSASANFSLDLLRSAQAHYQDIEAEDDLYIALRAAALQKLLEDPEVTSSDYNTVKALVNGDLDTYMGFKFKIIGSRKEGGLPGVAANRVAYCWAKQSNGYAVGIDMQTTIDWVPHKTSWLTNGMLKAGGVVREPQGIVKLQYNETI